MNSALACPGSIPLLPVIAGDPGGGGEGSESPSFQVYKVTHLIPSATSEHVPQMWPISISHPSGYSDWFRTWSMWLRARPMGIIPKPFFFKFFCLSCWRPFWVSVGMMKSTRKERDLRGPRWWKQWKSRDTEHLAWDSWATFCSHVELTCSHAVM